MVCVFCVGQPIPFFALTLLSPGAKVFGFFVCRCCVYASLELGEHFGKLGFPPVSFLGNPGACAVRFWGEPGDCRDGGGAFGFFERRRVYSVREGRRGWRGYIVWVRMLLWVEVNVVRGWSSHVRR